VCMYVYICMCGYIYRTIRRGNTYGAIEYTVYCYKRRCVLISCADYMGFIGTTLLI